jgi:bifunctional DNA primase/polymerase-like protein
MDGERQYHEAGRVVTSDDVRALRLALIAAGYIPIPLFGKAPPNKNNNSRKSFFDWEQTNNVTPEMLAMWAKMWPDAGNTGILTKTTPALDLDILNEEAARALEDRVRKHYDEVGHILVRIGLPPKRAILFRTEEPFNKFVINLIAPNAGADTKPEKIEFLAAGAQVAAFGTHPDTHKPYRWHGGEPGEIARDKLPYIREAEARTLVAELVQILVEQFGYVRAKERPKKASAGEKPDPATATEDWKWLFDNISAGRELHDSLCELAAKMIKSGASAGAAVNQLRALMQAAQAPHDKRWQERYDDIPRMVDSAVEKYAEAPQAAPVAANPVPPCTIADTLAIFDRWLLLPDPTPIYAMVGAVAANLLPGDPVWLGLIGPPSSAKTELLNSISGLPNVVQAATLTVAGLLSGTPKKQHTGGAKGGLLRQIGDFGIIALKDFGSVLSMPKPRCWPHCARSTTAPGLGTSVAMAAAPWRGRARLGCCSDLPAFTTRTTASSAPSAIAFS